jgi:hypothetical protein
MNNNSQSNESTHVYPAMYMTAVNMFDWPILEPTEIAQLKQINRKVSKTEKKEKASSKTSCVSQTVKKENEKAIDNQKAIPNNIKQMKMDETDHEANIKGYYKYSTIFK